MEQLRQTHCPAESQLGEPNKAPHLALDWRFLRRGFLAQVRTSCPTVHDKSRKLLLSPQSALADLFPSLLLALSTSYTINLLGSLKCSRPSHSGSGWWFPARR